MRILILISCLLVAACDIPGLDSGTGGGPSRTYSVSAFTGLTLAGPYDVVVTVGSTHAVRSEGDPQVLDHLTVRVEDGELWIGSERDGFLNDGDRGNAVVRVTVPRLESVTVGGSGDIRIDKMEGQSFEGRIGGSGDLQIGALAVRDAEFSIAGSGDLKVAGKTDQTQFKIAGSGDIDAETLQSRTAAISIAGSGSVAAHASESASISTSDRETRRSRALPDAESAILEQARRNAAPSAQSVPFA